MKGSSLEQELSVLGLVGDEGSFVSVASNTGIEKRNGGITNVKVTGYNNTHIEEEEKEVDEGSQFVSLSSVWEYGKSAENNERAHVTLVSRN